MTHAPSNAPPSSHPPVVIFGAGNMGSALLRGALAAGVLRPDRVAIADPYAARRDAVAPLIAARFADAPAAATWAREVASESPVLWLLAVKPQKLADVRTAVAPHLPAQRGQLTILSILAGTPLARLRGAFPNASLIRSMPNLPAAIGQGCTAWCMDGGVSADDPAPALARGILAATSPVLVPLPDELFDAFTAVAGSGPAYVFLLAEAMLKGALAAGLPADQARGAIAQTIAGAAALLARDPLTADPAALRASVTSPGGTTRAALALLDQHRVVDAFAEAILAARDRGRELARG